MDNRKRIRSSRRDVLSLNINDRFVEACASGDYHTVLFILESIKDFNIDVSDNLGRTALRLAVASEHLEVVQALLSKTDSQKLREALLLSIYMGHTQIAESILNHSHYKLFNDKKFLNGATDSFWQTPNDDAQFAPDITPIMLASQYNRTEIVQMLLLNGDRIEKPHEFHCECNECTNRFKFDSLRHAQSRLNAFRGLCSESYISLASTDPILTAFELGHELRYLAGKEKYFKQDYLQLAEMLSNYSVMLLSNIRGRDELEICLNKTGKENEEKYERLARLDMAIKYQEQPFVAHPNCQQKLVEVWYSGVRKLTKMNNILVILIFLGFMFLIPFGSLVFIIAPNSKMGKFMSLPCIKFFTYTVSYIFFIGMVIISSLEIFMLGSQETVLKFSTSYPNLFQNYTDYVTNTNLTYRFYPTDFYFRPHGPNYLDIAICVYILGMVLRELKKVIFFGIKEYVFAWSNIFTCVLNILFIGSFGLKFYTLITVSIEKEKLSDPNFWELVAQLPHRNASDQLSVYKTFYWLNRDRFYWISLDPINLSEGLFAVSIVFTMGRLCFWLPANQNLGPLQITLGQMISDILKFICIFMIVFTGFLFGLHNVFWYYDPAVRSAVEINRHDDSTKGGGRFGSVGATFLTMFFALYTLGESDDVSIQPFQNNLTPVSGYLLFGMYHITNITIMLSMLIAMMTKSFDSIMRHSDTEWKFSRSTLYMEFIKEGSVLPIPFNIIPTPASLYHLVKKVFSFRRTNQAPVVHPDQPSYYAHAVRPNQKKSQPIPSHHSQSSFELNYKIVMERVAKRFLLHNNQQSEEVKESDFDELKQDIGMFRHELNNDLASITQNLANYSTILQKGINTLCEHFFQVDTNSEVINRSKSIKDTGSDASLGVEVEGTLKGSYKSTSGSMK